MSSNAYVKHKGRHTLKIYILRLGKKSGYVRGLGHTVKPGHSTTISMQPFDLQSQLEKAKDKIETMRAAREKRLRSNENHY